MSIVTRTGDDGSTGLLGNQRIPKTSARIHAIGTVDELNAAIGCAISEKKFEELDEQLLHIQHVLFVVGTQLATPVGMESPKKIEQKQMDELESWIFAWEAYLPELTKFILPGGSRLGSHLHLARAICRRSERAVCALMEAEFLVSLQPVQMYLNRLSDYLFMAARAANHQEGMTETEV